MDLWIRSQDKEKLVKVNDITIRIESEDNISIKGYQIVGYFDKNTEYEDLGFYVMKERALEVLDEICKYKDKLDKAHFLGMTESKFVSSIYEMPQE